MTSPSPCGNLDEPYYKWVDTSNGKNGYYFIVEALHPEQHYKSIPAAKAVPITQKIPVPPIIPATTVPPMTPVVPTTTVPPMTPVVPTTTVLPMTPVVPTTTVPPMTPVVPTTTVVSTTTLEPATAVPSTTKAPPVPPPMPSPFIVPDMSSPSTNTTTINLTETPAQLQMEESVLPPPTTNATSLGLGEALAKFNKEGGKLRSHSKSANIIGRDKPVGSSSESSKGSNIGSQKTIGEKPALLPKPDLQQVLLSRRQVFSKSTDEEDIDPSEWD